MKNFWLVKQEPSDYSWADFVADGSTSWTGVRNFAARNNLRRMSKGDEVLFYHSGEDKAVVGIAKVARTAYRDTTAKEGDWSAVDLVPVKALPKPVTLHEIKAKPALKNIALVRQSRLSVMPLAAKEFGFIVQKMALGTNFARSGYSLRLFRRWARSNFPKMTSAVATQFLPVVAAASATKDFLVVSIHDVAPSTQPIVDKIISELSAKGVRHCSLLVVPDYHHQGTSMQDRQFVSWLRTLEAAGKRNRHSRIFSRTATASARKLSREIRDPILHPGRRRILRSWITTKPFAESKRRATNLWPTV